jgi:hypothetical protein
VNAEARSCSVHPQFDFFLTLIFRINLRMRALYDFCSADGQRLEPVAQPVEQSAVPAVARPFVRPFASFSSAGQMATRPQRGKGIAVRRICPHP